MDISLKRFRFALPNFVKQNSGWFRKRKIFFIIIITGILFGIPSFYSLRAPQVETDLVKISNPGNLGKLAIIEANSLLPFSRSLDSESPVAQKIPVVITAYSSTVDQTDSDPFITAAGTWVRDGIIANNLLPFGTKIRIPEIYGDKIFVVEDRMHWSKSNYHIDIWFPSYWEALNFGVKRSYIEILES